MRGSVFQAFWKRNGTAHVRLRGRAYDIPKLRVRHNSSTTTPTTNPFINSGQAKEGDLSLRLAQLIVQPSLLVTHGEGIFRLILVSQATFGAITAFWWHMHYFETQDEKNGWSSKFKKSCESRGANKNYG